MWLSPPSAPSHPSHPHPLHTFITPSLHPPSLHPHSFPSLLTPFTPPLVLLALSCLFTLLTYSLLFKHILSILIVFLILYIHTQVIITLQENPSGHIPYRNSKVTSVLRDSLGGNCKTTMIATVNLDDDFSMESIATCKFAARFVQKKKKEKSSSQSKLISLL